MLSLQFMSLHTAGLRAVYICRTFKEGIVPFKPTAYGLHNLLRRNDLLVSRAKVSDQSCFAVLQDSAAALFQQCCLVSKVDVVNECTCLHRLTS